ncbi:hypothetical protein ASPWEDRAFT_168660 [Aspergillus wentii DTO 134E9]|uniref:Methyltransferase n=1 Tax=Aspergillus wentii DTO 134E9 TaxID=1073089 RepID=A0A1L9RV65_ASPWE|nr:uncharacterized protein ASPWEDRAFT_168660 [Aspergillus wentii DTO 134E9]KAI9928687.1 hypothetical protein MW887_001904 [Aspergillus wentii]OJJ38774.1 hypothetical protein ASPWEDRAFT_168660 [Aspergillus wentii DTO 134E9]
MATSLDTKRHVQTDMVFRKRTASQHDTIDFTKTSPEQFEVNMKDNQEKRPVLVHDVRGEESSFTLDTNGFQYVRHEVPGLEDWNEEQIRQSLIPATEDLVRKVTGAHKTVTFTHRIRCFATDTNKLAANQAPAHGVHSDFTVEGARHHLENVVKDPVELAALKQGQVLAINVWRPLKTVRKDPLAVCDWLSVNPQEDWHSIRMTFPHGWNELGHVAYRDSHRWYYLSGQRPDEALIFKQFDSAEASSGGATVAHTAFEDPETVDCKPRVSVEIKMFAFVD